jgi:membrane-associated phospholipid phosphatase
MQASIRNNQWFLLPYLISAMFCLMVIMSYSQSSIHLFLNSHYNDFADVFFKYLTYLGDGIIYPFLIAGLIFMRFRYAFFILAVYAVSGLFTQLLKRTYFNHVPRPTKFFEGTANLHLVNGVKQLSWHSFPSGHSASAFAIMICFALLTKNNLIKLICFIIAALTAYSRVYLSQHFLVDILAGSFVGVLTGLWMYHVITPLNWTWLDKNVMTLKAAQKSAL